MEVWFGYACVALAIFFFILGLVRDYRQKTGFWAHRAPEKLWEVVSLENVNEFTAKLTLRHPDSQRERYVAVPRKFLIDPPSQ